MFERGCEGCRMTGFCEMQRASMARSSSRLASFFCWRIFCRAPGECESLR